LAIDQKKLGSTICKILQAVPAPHHESGFLIGAYPVMAGVAIPLALVIPDPDEAQFPVDVKNVTPPAVLLVPTPTSMSGETAEILKARGFSIWALSEFVRVDEEHRLFSLHEPVLLFESLKSQLLADHRPKAIGRIWELLPDAEWSDLQFEFVSNERLKVRYQQRSRTFEPDQFDMKNKNTGKPTNGWTLLRTLAMREGELTWVKASDRVKMEKQKQLLSDRLKTLFGIKGEPFERRPLGGYRAVFPVHDGRSQGEREYDR
jgi:hypothetical protein